MGESKVDPLDVFGSDPILISAPNCPRCNRTEAPVIVPAYVAQSLQNLLTHIKADVCCKKCGAVMDLEMSRG